ncbi:MAG: hypothetical protein ABSD75_10795 [Terriglobales bacterium]|jgi:hypothetical protein
MKSALFLALVLLLTAVPLALAAPIGIYQQGTVVRMHMGDCMLAHHGLVTFGPAQGAVAEENCPEYTLVTDKVVFLIVGKSSNQLVPLAEIIDFRFQNKELAVRVDDARHESKFVIKEMTLRSEWDRLQKHIERQLDEPVHQPMDTSMALRNR